MNLYFFESSLYLVDSVFTCIMLHCYSIGQLVEYDREQGGHGVHMLIFFPPLLLFISLLAVLVSEESLRVAYQQRKMMQMASLGLSFLSCLAIFHFIAVVIQGQTDFNVSIQASFPSFLCFLFFVFSSLFLFRRSKVGFLSWFSWSLFQGEACLCRWRSEAHGEWLETVLTRQRPRG